MNTPCPHTYSQILDPFLSILDYDPKSTLFGNLPLQNLKGSATNTEKADRGRKTYQ